MTLVATVEDMPQVASPLADLLQVGVAEQATDGEAGSNGPEQEGAGPVPGEALQVVEGSVEVALAEPPGTAINLVGYPADRGGGHPTVLG